MLTRLFALLLALPALWSDPAFAADHAAANEDIWPSQNDVAQTPGNGKKLLENQWANLAASALIVNNYSLSGLTVPGTSASLSLNVAAGTAYVAGRWVSIPASTSVTATASTTNYVFLKLTRDGSNLVTGVAFEVNISGTAPADSTPIAILTAGGSTITATTDKRIFPTTIEVLTSGTSWIFPAGITRVYVEVFGAGGGGGGGGEGYDNTGPTEGSNGTSGGTGGTTTFGALTGAGGGAGAAGIGGKVIAVGGSTPIGAAGTGSGGAVNLDGKGMPGGSGGSSGGNNANNVSIAWPGGSGGPGGYAAGWVSGTGGSTVTYAIGAAGTAGSAGTGNPGADGGAGIAGKAGRVVVHY